MNFIKRETKSGVPLYVLPMPAANTVATGVLVNVGSRDERLPDEAGLAHSFEHLFFQGTRKFPDQKSFGGYIESIGGNQNAFTFKERTFFVNQVPFSEFDRAVEFLNEQIEHSLIPENTIEKEMKVIIQEQKRKHDNPSAHLYEVASEVIFGDHPIAHPILGSEKSVSNFKREDFVGFMKKYYNSANFIFLCAGRVSADEAVEMFDKYFQEAVPGEKNVRNIYEAQIGGPGRVHEFKGSFKQANIYYGIPIQKSTLIEDWSLSLFAFMLGKGMSSPLFEEIRDKRGLCYTVRSNFTRFSDIGIFSIYLATSKDRYKEAVSFLYPLIEATKSNAELLAKAKKMEFGSLARKFENPSDVIFSAASEVFLLGKPYGYEEIQEAIQNVTIDDIKNVVEKYLIQENFSTVALIPEKD